MKVNELLPIIDEEVRIDVSDVDGWDIDVDENTLLTKYGNRYIRSIDIEGDEYDESQALNIYVLSEVKPFKKGDRVYVNDNCTITEWHGVEATVVDVVAGTRVRVYTDKPVDTGMALEYVLTMSSDRFTKS